MRDQLVTETIDARILRLVGLEDVFDLDYDTYILLLREAQVKGKNKIPAEEQALLANERKRVKGKTGRFKTKSKKIRVENITSVQSMGRRLLPGTRPVANNLAFAKSLVAISKTVESISENLTDQSKAESKEAEDNRKEEENKKRRQREESLESGVKKVAAAAKKLFAPVKGIFDAIFNYIYYTFLGKGLISALDWLANPENKTKIEAIGKFVKDFWPALLGAATFFFTPLGRFIKTVVSLTTRIIRFLRPFKKGAVSPAGMAVGTAISTFEAERRRQAEEERLKKREAEKRGVSEETVGEERKQAKLGIFSLIGDAFSKIGPGYMGIAGGGFVDQNTGLQITGAGPDTQLTALQPGEVVMNRAAVRAIGADKLLRLNSIFGGPNANKPRFANNIQLAQGGGMIGALSEWWNRGRNVQVPNENVAKFGGLKQYFKKVPDPTTLLGNDRLQSLLSDTAFKSGQKPTLKNWRPWRGFIDEREVFKMMKGQPGDPFKFLKTAPTPAVRQAVERPLRALGSGLSKAGPALRLLGRGTQILNAPVIGDMLDPRPVGGDLESAIRRGDYKGPMPTPLPSRAKPNIITLPPSVEKASSDQPLQVAGSDVPSFSAIAPGNRRMENAQIYGIIQ